MIKILVCCHIPFDTTSFYRAYGVFHDLNVKMNKTLHFTFFRGGMTWADIGDFDIVFLQRPMTESLLKLAKYAQNLGVKIWCDFDDNLFTLPNENRAFFDFTDEIRKVMLKLLLLSDCVTVSTQALKEFFETMNVKNIEVVPNALNDEWHIPVENYNADSKVIVWRGSETHAGDLAYFFNPLENLIGPSTDTWHFMGYNPFLLTNIFGCYCKGVSGLPTDKIVVWKPEDVNEYHLYLKGIKPRVMHVPLVDNPLNKCKSNIAWIEATYAGAVTIAPDWPEWKRPGVITYSNEKEYEDLLRNTSIDNEKCWKASMEFIKNNLLLSIVNKKRVNIINRLTGRPEEIKVEDKWLQVE